MFFGGLSREGGWLIDQLHCRYSFGPFHLDADQHLLTANGETIALPPKCFDLLCLLVSSPGQLLEKDGLIRTLWPETFVEEANLSNLIALLRKALGDSPASAQYIRTVPKLGYRFVAPVNSLSRRRTNGTEKTGRRANDPFAFSSSRFAGAWGFPTSNISLTACPKLYRRRLPK